MTGPGRRARPSRLLAPTRSLGSALACVVSAVFGGCSLGSTWEAADSAPAYGSSACFPCAPCAPAPCGNLEHPTALPPAQWYAGVAPSVLPNVGVAVEAGKFLHHGSWGTLSVEAQAVWQFLD